MRKSLAMLLSVVLALTLLLTACGGKGTQNGPGEPGENGSNGSSQSENGGSGTVDTQKLAEAKCGDVVTVGAYEQDNNKNNGKEPIEWIVVTKLPGKALVVSKYVLERMPFEDNDEVNAVKYPDSTVRAWLNGDFYEEAFSDAEKAMIPLTNVVTTYIEDYQK